MARIPLPAPEDMSAAQKKVYEEIVGGRRGKLVGPLRAALHNAELADRWQRFGAALRFETSLPRSVTELAILVTARRWNSQIEFLIHAKDALEAGIPAGVIEQIRLAQCPDPQDVDQRDVYEYTRQLQMYGDVAQDLYDRVLERWHPVGMVELTAVIGYYAMVSMTLNAHQIPLPDGAEPPLQPVARSTAVGDMPEPGGFGGLTALPPCAPM